MKSQTDWKLHDGTPITQVEVAKFLHITDRQIRYLIKQMPEHAKKNLADALEWYFSRELMLTDEEGNQVSLDDIKVEKLFHETKKARADAGKAKISEEKERHELDIMKGIFVERETVEHRIADISKKFSDKLFALPNRVVSLIMQANSPSEITKILTSELRKITKEVDSWQIFP